MGRNDREKQRKAKARREKHLQQARQRAKANPVENRGPAIDEHRAFAEKPLVQGLKGTPPPPRQTKTG
jgi:hypothetical protein